MTLARVVAAQARAGRRLVTLAAPELARAARPGQFVMVAVPGSVLRRPFWIAGLGPDTLDLVVEVVGPGTAWLAGRGVGEELDMLGPLGRPVPEADRPVLVGDVTAGPLRALAQTPGSVLAETPHRLDEALAAGAGEVYAAGPPDLLSAAVGAAARRGVRCLVAVTPPMACGTGLCWTCAVPLRDGPPVRACMDGPLLDGARVDLRALAPAPRPVVRRLDPQDVDLAVDLGPVRLANPVLAASGTAGSGLDLAQRVKAGELGAVVAKTVTLRPRAGRPGPRMVETAGGMLNSIGLQNPGIAAWLEHSLTPLLAAGVPVIASIAGNTTEEYGLVAARLPPGLLAVEANISCPNVEDRGRVFATRPGPAARAVAAAVAATRLPVFAKLTADVTDITEVAAAVLEAGAAGVTVANTLSGLAIDAVTRRPRLGGGTGGLSGPAVKPVALRAVAQVAQALPGTPIIGLGGIRTAEDAVEFLLAGASAVAVGTASFPNPRAALDLVETLPRWLAEHGVRTVAELVGALEW